MNSLKYPLFAVLSVLGTIVSYLIAPIACLFLDADGNLKYLRGWLQPSDNPAIGDALWAFEHPTYSPYKLAVTYCWREITLRQEYPGAHHMIPKRSSMW